MEDHSKQNRDLAGESRKQLPDPIAQGHRQSGLPEDRRQPARLMRGPEGIADVLLRSDEYVGMREPVPRSLSANDIVQMMLRHKLTILVVFVLVAAPAITAIWTLKVPKYQAKAEVRVRPIIPFLVFRTEDSGAVPLYESYVSTQISIIRGAAIPHRVLDQQEVQQTRWYKNPPNSLLQRLGGDPLAPADRFRDALSAKHQKGTEIIDITFTDSSPQDAQIIVNAVLDQYMKYIGEVSDATQDKLYTQLADQYRSLDDDIRGRVTVTAELRQQLGTATPEELISGQRVRLDKAQASLAEVRQGIALLGWEIEQAEARDSNDAAAEDIGKQLMRYGDAEWRRLDSNVRALRHAIATSVFTKKHPDAVRARKDLEFAEELLRLREAQLNEQWREGPKNAAGLSITTTGRPGYADGLLSLKHQLDRAKYEEQLLVEDVNNQQEKFEVLFGSAQLLEKENTALSHKRELFDAVRKRLDQKNMERNVPGSIEVLTRARVPSAPYNDRRTIVTAMVVFLAMSLGSYAAFIRDSRNKAICALKDMPYPMQVQFLGSIPEFPGSRPSNGETRQALIESTRVVRTALLSRLDSQGCSTILVTSAIEGTGKSSFALTLGESLALAGKKVLLIDVDFQKMSLTKRVGLSGESGFIQSLRCCCVDKRHIFQTQTPGLSIVPAGKRGDEGKVLEEIANGAFHNCIETICKQYTIILLDGPPILPLADATILSSQVDGILMVERGLVSRRAEVISALDRLGSTGGQLLGTVLVG